MQNTTPEERILAYIDEHQHELYEQLSALVKIDTVNHRTTGNKTPVRTILKRSAATSG